MTHPKLHGEGWWQKHFTFAGWLLIALSIGLMVFLFYAKVHGLFSPAGQTMPVSPWPDNMP